MYEIGPCEEKKLLVAFILVFLSVTGLCQVRSPDSLRRILPSAVGIERFEVLTDLSISEALHNDYQESLTLIDEAFGIAHDLGDSSRMVLSGRLKGIVLMRLNRPSDAVATLLVVLPIARRNKHERDYRIILNSLGISYTFLGRYDEALKIHFENLALREADNDVFETSVTMNNIGLVYFKLKNYETALSFYMKALGKRLESGNNYDLDRLYINLGLCYNQLRNFAEAEKSFKDGFSTCGGKCQPAIIMEGKFGQGVANYGMKNYEEALSSFHESLNIAETLPSPRFQAENLIYIARILVEQGRPEDAVSPLTKCERLAYAGNFAELLIETYREFSDVYKATLRFEQASQYQSRYIQLKDSIYSERLIENIARVQTEFAERENIKTIASNQAVIRQQRDLNVAVAIIAILAGLLILVLQRSNRVSKQVNAQLSEAKETIQSQNKLLEMKNKDLDREVEKKTADLERVNLSLKQVNDELDNFIYKTSHDIRGPLASLKGMCNVALMDVSDELALDYLRKLDLTAERLNSILTRLLIVNQINNSKITVSRIDFDRIVNEIMVLERKKGLPTKIEIRKKIAGGPEMEIQSDKELVRIVLENLIDNAIKFYNDSDRVHSFVEINIGPSENGSVKARVIDNGIGISESNPGKLFQMFFRASERSEIGGIGLYIVKTATAKIGGKVGLLTTPEGYTEFYVTFPATPPSPDDWPQKTIPETLIRHT